MNPLSVREPPLHPTMILDALLEMGAAASYEVPLDRAGRNVADVVAFLGSTVYVLEIKPQGATRKDLEQVERYTKAALRHWPESQVYGFLVARYFDDNVYPRGHVFLQRWPL